MKSEKEELVNEIDLDSIDLTEAERKILTYFLQNPKCSKWEIHKSLQCSYVTVWKAFKNPAFLSVISSVSKNTVHELALLASQVLRDILLTASPQVKFNAAISVLKNCGAITEKTVGVQQAVMITWAKPDVVDGRLEKPEPVEVAQDSRKAVETNRIPEELSKTES